jgi:hypothetical protein
MVGGRAETDGAGNPIPLNSAPDVYYHPTFLYELVWSVGVAVLVWELGKRFDLGNGRQFALYVMGYTAGRFWIEMVRTDPANEILGVRVNVWVSGLVFLAALLYFLRVRGGREFLIPVTPAGTGAEPGDTEPAGDVEAEPAADVGGRGRAPAYERPPGYLVVTEEQYRAYQRTGEVPAGFGDPAAAAAELDAAEALDAEEAEEEAADSGTGASADQPTAAVPPPAREPRD